MGRNVKSLMVAGGLGVVSIASFTGCATSDRSTGQYIDDRMTARRVKSELGNNPIYKFEDVSVNTYRGVVQLNGWVTQSEQKQVAEKIALSTPGVLDVVNNLTMKPTFQLVPAGQSATGGTSSGTIQRQGEESRELQREQQRSQEELQRQREQQQERSQEQLQREQQQQQQQNQP